MADDRKTIIINEIKYWKQHKLLPEVYCDFLLVLYTNGSYEEEEMLEKKKPIHPLLYYIQVFLLTLMVPFSMVVIYCTQFDVISQLGILILFISYAAIVFLFHYFNRKNRIQMPLIVLLVLVLLVTLYIGELLLMNQWFLLGVQLVNFSVWILLGWKFQLKTLLVFSGLGIIITLFYNFSHLFSLN